MYLEMIKILLNVGLYQIDNQQLARKRKRLAIHWTSRKQSRHFMLRRRSYPHNWLQTRLYKFVFLLRNNHLSIIHAKMKKKIIKNRKGEREYNYNHKFGHV